MTTIFRRSSIDKEKLREIILKNPGFLQPGLSFIDAQLDTEEQGIIDFLGADASGRLVVVNFDIKENDDLIISSLSQVQWLVKTQNLLKRLFFSENVNFTQSPQMLLIAPSFSEKARSAAKQLLLHDVRFIEYKYVYADEEDAIIFEEVFYNKKCGQTVCHGDIREQKVKEVFKFEPPVPARVKAQTKPAVSVLNNGMELTPQEVAEFMNFDKTVNKDKTPR